MLAGRAQRPEQRGAGTMTTLMHERILRVVTACALVFAALSEGARVIADDSFSLGGNGRPVWSVAFTADGKTLVSASAGYQGEDPCIRVWDVATRRTLTAFVPFDQWVFDVTFSPDGETIAATDHGTAIKLWEAKSGKLRFTLDRHRDKIMAIAFSPDGKTLASAGFDKTVRLWSVMSGEESHVCTGHSGLIYRVAFSRDGRFVASASDDHDIRIWNAESGGQTQHLTGHRSGVHAVEFFKNDLLLLTAGTDDKMILWDVKSGRQLKSVDCNQKFGVFGASFSRDFRSIVTVGASMATELADVAIWNSETLANVCTLRKAGSTVETVQLSPDGAILAVRQNDDTIRLWEVSSCREVDALKGHKGTIRSLVFSPDGKSIASSGDDGTIKIWAVPERRPVSGR
jgi:WD40 repeat protein